MAALEMGNHAGLPLQFGTIYRVAIGQKSGHSGEPRIGSGAGAGIQLFQDVLDPGFLRGDD